MPDTAMELNDVGRRVLGQHWRLILSCVLLGLAVAIVAHGAGGSTYTAKTRLVLDTPDPKSRAESLSIADTAKAIVTSRAQVEGALREAHVAGRDPVELAKKHVDVQGLGTSAVLELSVTDSNPKVATAVANALARRLIRARIDVSSGQLQKILDTLAERIDALSRRIAVTGAEIDALDVELAHAPTAATRTKRDAAARSRDFLVQQRSVLQSERDSLLSTNALRPKPAVISAASVPVRADPSGWLPDLVLGALLGLILGVGAAGLVEMIRPTLAGGHAVARTIDAAFLGALRGDLTDEPREDDLVRAAGRIRLVAQAAGVDTVALMAVADGVDLRPLAERLDAVPAARFGLAADAGPDHLAATPSRGGAAATGGRSPSQQAHPAREPFVPQIEPFGQGTASSGSTGVVLVAPNAVKRSDLDDFSYMLRVTPLPVLGVLTYAASRVPRGARRRTSPREAPTAAQP